MTLSPLSGRKSGCFQETSSRSEVAARFPSLCTEWKVQNIEISIPPNIFFSDKDNNDDDGGMMILMIMICKPNFQQTDDNAEAQLPKTDDET